MIWSSRPPLAALALAALMASGATLRASDRWAPGARDPAWEQLGALQAWRAGSPPFDAPALASHRDPLLREVLAAALGRDGARSPELLAALADDPERAVRVAALWGLLQADDVAGRAALLAAVGRSDDQLFAGGDLFWRIGLPRPFGQLPGPARREWLAHFDAGTWDGRPNCFGRSGSGIEGLRVHAVTAQSEWDADASVELSVEVEEPPCGETKLRLSARGQALNDDVISLGEPAAPRAPGFRLRTADGATELTVRHSQRLALFLSADHGLLPGVYRVQALDAANPLLFRVRRSPSVERALPGLLDQAATDPRAALRLARLRAQAAAPSLLAAGRSAGRSGRVTTAGGSSQDFFLALARTEDPQAAAEALPGLLGGLSPNVNNEARAAAVTLKAWGGLALPHLEKALLAWAEEPDKHLAPLAAMVALPGFARDSAVDLARVQMARGLAPRADANNWPLTWLLTELVQALMVTRPDVALETLATGLRAPAGRLLAPSGPAPAGLALSPARMRALLLELWPGARADPSVGLGPRADLAFRLAEADEWPAGLDTVMPASVQQARGWLQSGGTSASQRRFAAAAAERLLAVRDDPSLRALQAAAWLELGEAERAVASAELALARLSSEPELRNQTRVVLGQAAAATGRTGLAERALAEALDGEVGTNDQRIDLESALLALRGAHRVPGLELRRWPVQHLGPNWFWRWSGRSLIGKGCDDALEEADLGTQRRAIFALVRFPVLRVRLLDEDRLVVAGEDGGVTLLERGQASPRWRHALERPTVATVVPGQGVVLVGGFRSPAVALAADSGRVLWTRREASLWAPPDEPIADRGLPPRGLALLVQPPGAQAPAGRLLVVGQRDGRTRWSAPLWPAAVASTDNLLVVAPRGGQPLTALQLDSGSEAWSAALPAAAADSALDVVASADGRTLFVASGPLLQARAAATGALRWQRAWAGAPSRSPAAVPQPRAVGLHAIEGGVLAVIDWSAPAGGPQFITRSGRDLMLLTSSGEVVFQESRGGASGSAVQVRGEQVFLQQPGRAGRAGLEVWDLARVPRQGRRAPRDPARRPGPMDLAAAPSGLSGTVDGLAVSVERGRLVLRRAKGEPAVALSVSGTGGPNGACQLDAGPPPEVSCPDLRPGLGLSYSDVGVRTELRLTLAPGVKPSDVGLAIEGVEDLTPDGAGGLHGRCALGELRLFPPLAFEELEVGPVPVQATLVLEEGGRLRVEVGRRSAREPLQVVLEASLTPASPR